jgi:RimJ/RimL family protein N-acetyltransferase
MSHASPAPSIELLLWKDEDWPLLWVWMQPYWSRVANDFSPDTIQDFVSMKRSQNWHRLAVYRNNELGGILEAEHVSPVVAQVHVTFKKSFWGWQTTLPAMRLGMEYLWRQGYSKIRAQVYPDNRAIIRVIKTLGGRLEAVLNSETKRDGKLTDLHQYCILKGEDNGMFIR